MSRMTPIPARPLATRASVFAVLGAAAALTCLASPPGALRLTAKLDRAEYVSGAEMALTVVLANDDATVLPVLRADSLAADFMRFEVLDAQGQPVASPVKRTPIPNLDDPIELLPGARVELEFDLHDDYPLGLPPGEYRLVVTYRCPRDRFPEKSSDLRDVTAQSPPLSFRVTPRSPTQERQADAFRTTLRAADDLACARAARRGLSLDDGGLFSRRLRIELAAALWRSGERAAAVELYTLVADDDSATPATRRLARFNLGLIYHELGERDAAIDMMRQVGTRAARHYADDWTARRDGRSAEGG